MDFYVDRTLENTHHSDFTVRSGRDRRRGCDRRWFVNPNYVKAHEERRVQTTYDRRTNPDRRHRH